jgi:hypothetical protein
MFAADFLLPLEVKKKTAEKAVSEAAAIPAFFILGSS